MKKILLIEDDLVIRENTKELLEFSDYEVIIAANGRLGVALALENSVDIILCDIIMPVLDGYATFKILSQNPQTKTIPFVLLSAKSEITDIRKSMGLGADDFLTKPFSEVDPVSKIKSCLFFKK